MSCLSSCPDSRIWYPVNVNLQAAAWEKHCQFIIAAYGVTTAGLQSLTIH